MSTEEIRNGSISVREFAADLREDFDLKLIAGKSGLENVIDGIEPHRPGLAFSGYTDHFKSEAVQIAGQIEISYLNGLSNRVRSSNLKKMFQCKFPCLIVSKGQEPPKILKILCNEHSIPLFQSSIETSHLFHKITIYLMNRLAPSVTLHGTLVDVYGIGVLITGKSGIGKSECALDLIDRGHRLVCDDAVKVYKRAEHIIMGTGIAPEPSLQYHMEVRGIGILDMAKIYGIRGVRLHKRIEIQIDLQQWQANQTMERVGLKEETTSILGVEIPFVKISLVPGKNISVIAEVVALNHLLKISGYDTAKMFNATLIKLMQQRAKKLARLDEDEE